MGLYNKILDFIGIEEADEARDEFFEEDPQQPANDNVVSMNRTRRPQRESAHQAQPSFSSSHADAPVVPNVAAMKMIVYHPVSYEDAKDIIDNLNAKKPVIINMEELDIPTAQRIFDFVLGGAHALHATTSKISRQIFVLTPKGCDIVDNSEDDYSDY